jgi:hypothetical protein
LKASVILAERRRWRKFIWRQILERRGASRKITGSVGEMGNRTERKSGEGFIRVLLYLPGLF